MTNNAQIRLFPREQVVGVFRGFQQGGLEFHADLVLPYRNDFQNTPMHGQFLLVQLETTDEAVLGRITSFSSDGRLAASAGEEFNIRAVMEDRPIPEDLREQYLKYRVNIRVLGVLRNGREGLTFVPSHRRLPHLGSKVAFPSGPVLQEIAGHNAEGAAIGRLAYGEYIYAAEDTEFNAKADDWMQVVSPSVMVHFPVESLVSRRSFVFARAGFGKSNLNKLLFSMLYETTPYVTKRDKQVPVGTVIFDPEGEYFWPDDRGRPGLCDVPHLEDKLVVFTERRNPSGFYQGFVAGGIKLDIRRLRPNDVIGIALNPDRQEQQNVRKLRGLPQHKWERLVDLIDADGNTADMGEICRLLDLDEQRQEFEALAARANMTAIVRAIHDKRSQLMDRLIYALSEGKLCVIDVSQMRGSQSLMLSGLILRRIFDRNQEQFTAADPQTIPTIAVVEEAQTVLGQSSAASEPYLEWVKEGRKYDLGALLITQQPSSIHPDLLSQGDNWFVFHLLSANDLTTLKRANAHFSDDLLSSLLNEPIPGHGVFWSSVGGKPYPLSIRALSFEEMYPMRDADYSASAGKTYATAIPVLGATVEPDDSSARTPDEHDVEAEVIDVKAQVEQQAITRLQDDAQFLNWLASDRGAAYGTAKARLLEGLPEHLDDRDQFAYHLVQPAMDQICGDGQWETYKNEKGVTYIKGKPIK